MELHPVREESNAVPAGVGLTAAKGAESTVRALPSKSACADAAPDEKKSQPGPLPQRPQAPSPPLARRPIHASAFTEASTPPPDDDAASGDEIGDAPNALFANNPAFAAVFKSSLSRQGGASALTSGPPAEEPRSRSGLEEVLHTALRNQRGLLLELEDTKKRVEAQLVREQKQFERHQFALKKSIDDHAYTTSMDKLRAREKAEWREEKERLMKGE